MVEQELCEGNVSWTWFVFVISFVFMFVFVFIVNRDISFCCDAGVEAMIDLDSFCCCCCVCND